MKNIVLFGPTGMVGSRLFERLSEEEVRVFCWTRKERELPEIIDVFIYVAAVTFSRFANVSKYVMDNCAMAVEVVEECKKHDAKRIVYLSSDEVYGELETEELKVESDKINLNTYAMTKILSEKIIIESGIPYYIIRSPAIIGENREGRTFLERTAQKMFRGENIFCAYADDEFNNVVHVSEIVDFIIRLSQNDKETNSKILHVGQTKAEKIINILTYMKLNIGSQSKIIPIDDKGRHFILPVAEAEEMGFVSYGIYHILDEIIAKTDTRISSKNVEFLHKSIFCLNDDEKSEMKNKARLSLSSKYRICLHEDINDTMHVMFSIYPAFSYIRPHYHPEKSELKILVEGSLLEIIYDKSGNEIKRTKMTKNENEVIYLKPNIIHTNIPLTDCILLEVTPGPFDREKDNIFLGEYPEVMRPEEVREVFNL